MNLKINSRPLFTIILKLKNDNFKTRDFSLLIERVLAGVFYFRILACSQPFRCSSKMKSLSKFKIPHDIFNKQFMALWLGRVVVNRNR